jgi:hypothetical protein
MVLAHDFVGLGKVEGVGGVGVEFVGLKEALEKSVPYYICYVKVTI